MKSYLIKNTLLVISCLLLFLPQTATTAESDPMIPVRVEKGTNLIHLARDYCMKRDNWHQIARINQLKPPFTIQPGTTLQVPYSLLITENVGAEVISVSGKVYRKNDKKNLIKGDKVFAGQTLQSGSEGFAHLLLPNHKHTRIAPNTTFTINYLFTLTDGSLKADFSVKRGRIIHAIKQKLGMNEDFQTRTPVSITGVRGTEFRVKMSGDDINLIETLSGKVTVDANGQSMTLNSGQGSRIEEGKIPEKPKTLPTPPVQPELQPIYKKLPVSFHTQDHDTAKKFRIRLCTDPEGNSTFYENTTEAKSKFIIAALVDGTYYAYLTAIDEQGFESKPGTPFTVNLRTIPAPPIIREPKNNQTLFKPTVTVNWLKSEHVDHFKVQLAKDEEFKDIIEQQTLKENSFTASDLTPGTYYFRISGIAPDGFESLFSSLLTWKIVEVPSMGDISPSEDGVFQWSPMEEKGSFDLQIAKDKNFKNLIIAETGLDRSEYTIPQNLSPGKYHIRIRGVLESGEASPWSQSQIYEVKQPPLGIMGVISLALLALIVFL